METQTALVRTDGTVELDAETAVDLDAALIIVPRHAEHEYALGLHQPLENAMLFIFRVTLHYRLERFEHFFYRLVEFGFGGILSYHQFIDIGNIGHGLLLEAALTAGVVG